MSKTLFSQYHEYVDGCNKKHSAYVGYDRWLEIKHDELVKCYVSQDRALEIIEALEKAGMGKLGKPNTLVSQVYEIIASRDAWKALAERLAGKCEVWVDEEPRCIHCNGWMDNKIPHVPDCPITLHQLLIEEEK